MKRIQGRIAGKSGGEAHIKMRLRPVHELMAAEVAVATKFDDCMWPRLVQTLDYPVQYAEDIQRFVTSSGPKQRKDEFAVHAVEDYQRHIAVFIVIVIEQCEEEISGVLKSTWIFFSATMSKKEKKQGNRTKLFEKVHQQGVSRSQN